MENAQQNQDHDLHSALKSCKEITYAQTLFNWIKDLETVANFTKHRKDTLDHDEKFQKFAKSIVVATEIGYDPKD